MQQMHRFGILKKKNPLFFFCSEENLKLIIIFMEFLNIKVIASFHLTLALVIVVKIHNKLFSPIKKYSLGLDVVV
jgi:hypothetical protein